MSIVSGEPVEADQWFRESLFFVPMAKLVATTKQPFRRSV